MNNKVDVSLTHLNAFSPKHGLIGLLGFPNMLEDDMEFCRLTTAKPFDNKWGQTDLEFQCKSVTFLVQESKKGWWILGKNGQVAEVSGGQSRIEQIQGAGLHGDGKSYGYVEVIKYINDELYVCGYGRQVYKRSGEQWHSIAGDMLTRENARGFFDMDGVDGSHLFAVGWQGEIWYYDGNQWHKEDTPTNVHLGAIKVVSKDDVWIAGDHGLVLHGGHAHWTIIESPDFNSNWYAVEEFEGKIYLAGNGVLAYIDGDRIKPVDTGLNKEFTTNKLHAKEGLLWSIGSEDILVFDGSVWKEVLHPDNV